MSKPFEFKSEDEIDLMTNEAYEKYCLDAHNHYNEIKFSGCRYIPSKKTPEKRKQDREEFDKRFEEAVTKLNARFFPEPTSEIGE